MCKCDWWFDSYHSVDIQPFKPTMEIKMFLRKSGWKSTYLSDWINTISDLRWQNCHNIKQVHAEYMVMSVEVYMTWQFKQGSGYESKLIFFICTTEKQLCHKKTKQSELIWSWDNRTIHIAHQRLVHEVLVSILIFTSLALSTMHQRLLLGALLVLTVVKIRASFATNTR